MHRIILFITLFFIYSALYTVDATEAQIDPQKETATVFSPAISGFGSKTVGGSGRNLRQPKTQIVQITSLADSGSGTLRDCIEMRGPRTCVFAVSGIINLASALTVSNPYITIAGQSAPHPGIALHRAGLLIETHDVVVEHLAIRVGDSRSGPNPGERDGLRIGGEKKDVYNVIADHLSVTWALDENVSVVSGAHDVTISSTLIAEGLDHSIHPKGPHSKGILIAPDCKNISLIGNVVAFHGERNPLIQPGSTVQFINNLVYGWGQKSYSSLLDISDSGGLKRGVLLDFIGNVYIAAPWSTSYPPIFAKPADPATRVYVKDNRAPTRSSDSDPEWAVVNLPQSPYHSETPIFPESLQIAKPSSTVLNSVLNHVGARPTQRARVDQRIINDIVNRKGSIKDCIEDCSRSVGGWPKLGSSKKKLKIPRKPISDRDNNGYLAIEEWLHSRADRLVNKF